MNSVLRRKEVSSSHLEIENDKTRNCPSGLMIRRDQSFFVKHRVVWKTRAKGRSGGGCGVE
jgi:hypothetical protein